MSIPTKLEDLAVVDADMKLKYSVTNFTMFRIWALLRNGRVRILTFPTQRFSEYTGPSTGRYYNLSLQWVLALRYLASERSYKKDIMYVLILNKK
jgi:hypothetical protein